jgi:mannose-6-phosphate isomerase-like protein (cupin superfamily)
MRDEQILLDGAEVCLEWIVGDVSTFASEYWGRRPMRCAATAGFEALLDLDGIERWLAEEARRPSFRLVKVGATFEERDYTRTVRVGGIDVSGFADVRAIAMLMAGGATLVMQNLEYAFPALARLVRELAAAISHPVQANAYLTPPNAAGLARHADDHGVLIVQLEGSKTWDVDGLGQFVIAPGDVIYIPARTAHVAHTSNHTSLHLTFGLLCVTTRHVLRRMLDRPNPALDEPLPLGFAQLCDRELAAILRPRLEQALTTLGLSNLEDVARAEAQRASKLSNNRLDGLLANALASHQLTLTSRLRRLVDCSIERGGDRVNLHLPDRTVSFPEPALRALQAVCEAREISVADLVGIDEPSRLVVAQRLIREGAVRPVLNAE